MPATRRWYISAVALATAVTYIRGTAGRSRDRDRQPTLGDGVEWQVGDGEVQSTGRQSRPCVVDGEARIGGDVAPPLVAALCEEVNPEPEIDTKDSAFAGAAIATLVTMTVR